MSARVLVLFGGESSEREISLVSGRACGEALERLGWHVEMHDWRGDLVALAERLRAGPDLVFNALHGPGGEDGAIRGVLDCAGRRSTHSPVLASALAMDKPASRRLFECAGIRVPPGGVMPASALRAGDPRPRPFVVKPVAEGSSVGVEIVSPGGPAPEPRPEDERVLVEAFVPGRELTVSVLEGRALGVTELRPRSGFYDWRAKYEPGGAEHLVPAPVPAATAEEARAVALRAHDLLGCERVSRADFRWDEEGGLGEPGALFLLEVNTQPGMTPSSLVPEQAAAAGIPFDELVARIAGGAGP